MLEYYNKISGIFLASCKKEALWYFNIHLVWTGFSHFFFLLCLTWTIRFYQEKEMETWSHNNL